MEYTYMTKEIDLFNKRLIGSVEQTMLLMTKSGKELINGVVNYVIHKIKATDLDGVEASAIYRSAKIYRQSREKVIRLSGLYTPLFGREKGNLEEEPFSLIVNIDDESLKQGFLWYSPDKDKGYRMSDLNYYVLDGNTFKPYKLNGRG